MVLRMKMGDLCDSLFAEVFTSNPKERPPRGDTSKGWIRTRFSFEPHPDFVGEREAMRQRWRRLVRERNQLVHHFFERWNRVPPDHLTQALDELDRQHESSLAVLDEVIPLLRHLNAARQEAATHFNSQHGERELLIGAAMVSVVNLLWSTAERKARDDGWTYETTALHALREEARDDAQLIRESHGPDWLREVLRQPGGAFEAMEEPLPNAHNQTRLLYRPRLD